MEVQKLRPRMAEVVLPDQNCPCHWGHVLPKDPSPPLEKWSSRQNLENLDGCGTVGLGKGKWHLLSVFGFLQAIVFWFQSRYCFHDGGQQTLVCGWDPDHHLVLWMKFCGPAAMPAHLHSLWLLLHHSSGVDSQQGPLWPAKPKMFTVWPFPEKVCLPLHYAMLLFTLMWLSTEALWELRSHAK